MQRDALRPGGILLAYLPTINQTAVLREALGRCGFGLAETVEILRRTWHIEARSVRPDHRMVAHTGFLTSARLLARPASSISLCCSRGRPGGPTADQSRSMKMHSPGHSSDASTTASSRSSGTSAIPAEPPGSFLMRVAFLHVGETVVEEGEDRRSDLFTEPVTGAQILIDPDLHR